ncbi:MAG: hypothetical protein GY807_08720 [Gammaproteobacteria bacterium]|nr:hypothetical protein [Gammaproteobacteria bacterium]
MAKHQVFGVSRNPISTYEVRNGTNGTGRRFIKHLFITSEIGHVYLYFFRPGFASKQSAAIGSCLDLCCFFIFAYMTDNPFKHGARLLLHDSLITEDSGLIIIYFICIAALQSTLQDNKTL